MSSIGISLSGTFTGGFTADVGVSIVVLCGFQSRTFCKEFFLNKYAIEKPSNRIYYTVALMAMTYLTALL